MFKIKLFVHKTKNIILLIYFVQIIERMFQVILIFFPFEVFKMNKKLIGICLITIFVIGISMAQPVMAKREEQKFNAELKVIGFIRIDSENYVIKGFVLVGNIEGESVFFERINIKYDGRPILVSNPMPFVFSIKYNTE